MTHAISLGEQLLKQGKLRPRHAALLHSYLANAWSGLRKSRGPWVWDSHELGQELLELRRAISEQGFSQLEDEAQCSIFTNLGNVLSGVGRVIEALPFWRRALASIPTFGMALANQGEGLISYARALSWSDRRNAFLEAALSHLDQALSSKKHPIEPLAVVHFEGLRAHAFEVFSRIPRGHLHRPWRQTLGRSAAEKKYRLWCLQNQLFLNPLNDLMQTSPAASDPLSCPPVVVTSDSAPYFVAAFDQLKQEFVSARYLYYKGITGGSPSFSDRRVLLHNTMDYPSYGLRTEQQKSAFRIAHSLFDKIALFLNVYMDLKIAPERVTFRKLWYDRNDAKRKDLAVQFLDRSNWPLRGLFWLSKDLFEIEFFGDVLEPDAQGLLEIRNCLEHRFLRLNRELGAAMPGEIPSGLIMNLAATEFEAKTLKLLKLTRAALIYLALSVWREEQIRSKGRPRGLVSSAELDTFEDNWKR